MYSNNVRFGYNKVHPVYLSHRVDLKSSTYVQKLLRLLRPHSTILDLGCGAGVPVDDLLIKAGHSVKGFDISEEMIAQARRKVPAGDYAVRDVATLKAGEFVSDAVVCFYALFHLPRGQHGTILRTIHSFLPTGGILLITMGDKPFEGFTDFYGVQMWWSQWGPTKNRELVQAAGFTILEDQIDRSGGESHQILLLRKK